MPHERPRIEPARDAASLREAWAAWGLEPERDGATSPRERRSRDAAGMATVLALVLLGVAAVLSRLVVLHA